MKKKILISLSLAVILAIVISSVALAQVWTDQPDYSPGDTVTIHGDVNNMQNGQQAYVDDQAVHVDVSGPNGWTSYCDTTVVSGAWSCQVTISDDPVTAAGIYTYTATSDDGTGNAIVETGEFTDGFTINSETLTYNSTIVPPAAQLTVPAGGTISVAVNLTTGSSTYANWSSTEFQFLHSGVYGSPICINNPGGVHTGTTATETYNVTVPSVAQTYGIRIRPYSGAGCTGVYTGSSIGNSIVVTAASSISISNIPSTAVYGGSFTATYTGTYDGTPSVTSSTLTKCTVSGDVISFVGVGTCTLTAHVTAGSTYPAGDGTPQSFSVGPATLTVTADNQTAQYSDASPTLTYQYSGFVNSDNSSVVTTAPSCDTTRTVDSPAGTYPITCSGGAADNYTFSYTPGTFTVTKEDATIAFDSSNPAALQVSAPGGTLNAGALSLKVLVREKQPDLPTLTAAAGDINNAGLTVTLTPLAGGSAIPLNCSSSVSGTGYAAINTFTCTNSAALPVNTYDVTASVTGNYYTAPDAYDSFTVYDPSLGFATGGGWFLWPGTTDKTNFGFVMKYNKGGTNLKGSLLVVRHMADGTIARIKSNALSGLAIQNSGGCGIATFSGKANYMAWDSVLLKYVTTGNNSFSIYAKDCNQPGAGFDYFWVFSVGNLQMTKPAAGANLALLGGGNIAIPHTAKK